MLRITSFSRRVIALTAALAVALTVLAAARAEAAVPETFTFRGSGFGHGVGMSQYGAYGQATEGRAAADILRHYYPGTSVDAVDDNVGLRVHLVAGASAQARGESLASGGGFIRAIAGEVITDAGTNEPIAFGIAGTQVTVTKTGSATPPSAADVVTLQWSGGPTLLNVTGPGEAFTGPGHRYRYGEIDIAVVDGALQVVLQISLHDHYLRGIAEMPSSWPAEALKVQAIAARTYALRKFRGGQRVSCRCHVFDTVADQVYAGWTKESDPTYGPKWVAAVTGTSPGATTGIVVNYGGELASTNYFSSSGGRTETNIDGFGGSVLFAYLRPVDDRWSLAAVNPFASWSFTRSQQAVAVAFGLPDVAAVDLGRRTAGGALRTATATSSGGQTATISGSLFRSRLELPSRWVGPAAVRVAGADRYSTSVAIGTRATAGQPSTATVVIASGETAHLVDGLVAAPLARLKSAPLLLATASSLPASVGDDVAKRKATTAYLVGGLGALGSGVEQGLRSRGVTTIKRLSGETRYDTGLAVAREMGGPRTAAMVASGEEGHLVDALAAGGPASAGGRPILLVTRDAVPAPTRQALTELGVTQTSVVGGPASVSDATMATLPNPERLAGPDRYSTATAIADRFASSVGLGTVVLGSGGNANLVDSLPGGALAAVTLLTAPPALPPSTATWLQSHAVGEVAVLGGTAAVSAAAFDQARAAVYPSGRFKSRIAGFDEVAFVVQPTSGSAVVSCGALADTPALRAQGMTGRSDFAGYDGMVFVMDGDTTAPFHMRNVPIALSIAWFDGNGRWVGAADMAPCGDRADCPVYPPPAPYRYAVEVPRGGLGAVGAATGSLMVAGGSCPA